MSDKYIPACRDGVTPLKRVAAIHDLSCFGRCALTVIIPSLSAMGVQVVPVPTCLLSSHTGGFPYVDLHFEDLSHSIEGISKHFDKLDLKFDAIYTGFLGSAGQIDSVKAFIDRFGEGATVLVDPVMGDDGRLYSTYTDELMHRMSELCRGADIITPNLTEACFLTGTKYMDTTKMSREQLTEYAHGLCLSLLNTGAGKIVITGLASGENELCVCGMDADENDGFFFYAFDRVDKSYPGTGDLFASVLLGGLMRGESFESAIRFAADFTARVMEYSSHFATPEREGVALEAFLGELSAHGNKGE